MNNPSVLVLVGYIFACAGGLFFISAAVGLVRFRDPYTRISAVATATGIGLALVTVGAVLTDPSAINIVKAVVAVVLQLTTSAVAGTLTARGAVNSGHPFSPETDLSALRDADLEAVENPLT